MSGRRLSAHEVLEQRHVREKELQEELVEFEREMGEERLAFERRRLERGRNTINRETLQTEASKHETEQLLSLRQRVAVLRSRKEVAAASALERSKQVSDDERARRLARESREAAESQKDPLIASRLKRREARRQQREREEREEKTKEESRAKQRAERKAARAAERRREEELDERKRYVRTKRRELLRNDVDAATVEMLMEAVMAGTVTPGTFAANLAACLRGESGATSRVPVESVTIATPPLPHTKTEEPLEEEHEEVKQEVKFMLEDQEHPWAKTKGIFWWKELSTTQRPFPEVPVPTATRLGLGDLVEESSGDIDTASLAQHFSEQGLVTGELVHHVLDRVVELLLLEPNVVQVAAPVTVVGDIHGQYFDLLQLFAANGAPELTPYLFLGDYVDRGYFGFEVFFLLLCAKLNSPARTTLLRGNHETRAMTKMHSFQTEIAHKFGTDMYVKFMLVCDCLPIAAVVTSEQGKFFCCHAGLSPEAKTLADLNELDRFMEPPDEGALLDVLWSDPTDEGHYNQGFQENTKRGCSYFFGFDALNDWLDDNGFLCLLRGHQVKETGYEEHWYKKFNPYAEQPYMVTLFSAPNYCDKYGNTGGYMNITLEDYTIHTYAWADHPYVLPSFKSAFEFSLPFVAENVLKFLLNLMRVLQGVDLEDEKEEEERAEAHVAEGRLTRNLNKAGLALLRLRRLRRDYMESITPMQLPDVSPETKQSRTPGVLARSFSESPKQLLRKRGPKRKSWFQRMVESDEENEKLVRDKDHFASAQVGLFRKTRSFRL